MSAAQVAYFAAGVLVGAVVLILAIWRLRRMAVEERRVRRP